MEAMHGDIIGQITEKIRWKQKFIYMEGLSWSQTRISPRQLRNLGQPLEQVNWHGLLISIHKTS